MKDDESINRPGSFGRPLFHGSRDSPPPSERIEVEFGARSRQGLLRPVNSDHYLIARMGRSHETLMTSLPKGEMPQRFDEFGYGMLVADGMGSAGEAASRLTISALVHLVIYFGKWNLRVDEIIAEEIMERVDRFCRTVDSTLRDASQNNPQPLKAALTAVYFAGTDLIFAHVGHSRAYLFRDDWLMQLTRDHTLDRLRPGKLAIVDMAASTRDRHHIVTETLGTAGSIDVERCGLLDGDLLLLCTNGLTDVVDDARIASVLRSHCTPDDQCRELTDLAANSRGDDNVTAVVAHYRIRA